MSSYFYLVLAFPILAVGMVIFFIARTMHKAFQERRRQATVKTEAKVVERLLQTRTGFRSAPHYAYEFQVKGITRRAQYGGPHRLREGDTVTIFYDPNCPEIIYLPEIKWSPALTGLYCIGGLWLLMGAVFLIYGILGIK